MDFDKVYTVKKEISKEQFMRAVLVRLASDMTVPVDAIRATFGEVRESEKEVVVCEGHVESDYTAEVGYDKEEEYTVQENKWMQEGDWYSYNGVKRQADSTGYFRADVVKKKIVTNWQPFSGHIGGDAVAAAINGPEERDSERLLRVLRAIRDEDTTTEGSARMTAAGLNALKRRCGKVVHSRIHLPGDRSRNFSASDTVTVQRSECWKLPVYETEYTYKGATYHVSGFACLYPDVEAECPPDEEKVVESVEKATRVPIPFRFPVFWALFALGVILMITSLNGATGPIYWMWVPTLLWGLVTILYRCYHEKKFRQGASVMLEEGITRRKTELSAALAAKGDASPLTPDEEALFAAEKEKRHDILEYRHASITIPCIACAVAAIVLMVASLQLNDKAMEAARHSPAQFTVSVVSKTTEYKESAYGYRYYYVNLTYEIEAKDIGANSMHLETTVYNKAGKELGVISSSLSDMNLAAHSKKQFSVRLEENRLEQGSIFQELYNTDYKLLTFEPGVSSISFPDQHVWRGQVTKVGGGKQEIRTKASVGLHYSANSDGTTCTVNGMGSCTDQDVVIPATSPEGLRVTGISERAFSTPSTGVDITSITIPDSVTWIGGFAFFDSSSLKAVYISDITAWCSIEFYDYYSNPLICDDCDLYLNGELVTDLVIPDGITSIKPYTFINCSSLASIAISNNVTEIGESAFNGCALTNVVIPRSVKKIAGLAFAGCNLTSITIPENVEVIGPGAFAGCDFMENMVVSERNSTYHSDGNCIIETASKALIAGCKNSVIPSDGSVMTIGDYAYAFYSCSSLTSITIPGGVTEIGCGAFYGCTSLTSITIPNSVTEIGYRAFQGCSVLTSITIPNSVTKIDSYAFQSCSSLTSITIPDSVTQIGGGAFSGCSSLTSITIPDSVTQIGGGAFSGCSSLTSITIPDSVTQIGDVAFWRCSALTSITIPDSVTLIGSSTFADCKALTKITFTGTKAQWNAISKGSYWYSNTGNYTVYCTDGTISK